ncbi:hypothetical protein PMAC_003150 [Pneumocystis sp. 'macacae']|nr:hypothetical protein PMAC_003150 [Pneumocystis sp. 'macacae']
MVPGNGCPVTGAERWRERRAVCWWWGWRAQVGGRRGESAEDGAGKTTFLQRLNAHMRSREEVPYIVNLDPAVVSVPYNVNIDICDTVNYREVMKQYGLGPNGAIVTSLNLFTTKFDQVLSILEKRGARYILFDTPGQIGGEKGEEEVVYVLAEIFTWSASGSIITDALASSFPTCIAYIVDTVRSRSCTTFMSSMLYACSILYKTKLPLVVVFNKTDVQDAGFAREWMTDFEAFQSALSRDEGNVEGEGGSGYMSSLMNSMSLMLEEFYRHLDVVAVSAVTGFGMDDFMDAIERKVEEYELRYRPELERLIRERDEKSKKEKLDHLSRLMKDIDINGEEVRVGVHAQTVSDVEEGSEDDQGIVDTDAIDTLEPSRDMQGDITTGTPMSKLGVRFSYLRSKHVEHVLLLLIPIILQYLFWGIIVKV